MDVVKHKNSEAIYSSYQVQNMSEEEQLEIKGLLICRECGKNAWFRKKSVDGKEPCFSAKHDDECKLKKSNNSTKSKENRMSQNKREADTNVIGIKFKDYFSNILLLEDGENTTEGSGKTGNNKNIYDKDPTQSVQKNWTLKRILDYALDNTLEKQGVMITINKKKLPLENIVHSWASLNINQGGIQGLFWGYLHSSDNSIWINSDKKYPYNNFSIKLSENIKKRFWSFMGKIEGEWENGVPAIVFGQIKKVTSGKYYIEVDDLSKLYINQRIYKSNSK
ncbi:hypothetical protein [Exiguobacterium sp. s48]|uniref:hypothetical protein n=1 Tax=Exiguobacterium sp. s48 TaxID=2751273 RepID=UPI001BE50DF8|nr:hypothetical protein [Exiguobacterium sp. s48]